MAADKFPSIVSASAFPQGETWTLAVTVLSPYDTPERYADGWAWTASSRIRPKRGKRGKRGRSGSLKWRRPAASSQLSVSVADGCHGALGGEEFHQSRPAAKDCSGDQY